MLTKEALSRFLQAGISEIEKSVKTPDIPLLIVHAQDYDFMKRFCSEDVSSIKFQGVEIHSYESGNILKIPKKAERALDSESSVCMNPQLVDALNKGDWDL